LGEILLYVLPKSPAQRFLLCKTMATFAKDGEKARGALADCWKA